MRSVFLSLLVFAFISVFALNAADFHCAGSSNHQASHQHESHEHDHTAGQDADQGAGHETGHEDCPPHLHTCCSTVFVFQSESKITLPLPAKTVFSENVHHLKPAPVLEGPFQPPRLS